MTGRTAMSKRLKRSIKEPIRDLDTDQRWANRESGLIWCWERGRQKRLESPELAEASERGELPILAWAGGVEKKLVTQLKPAPLNYLATWQGLRGEDLDIDIGGETQIECSKTGQVVVFSQTWRDRLEPPLVEIESGPE